MKAGAWAQSATIVTTHGRLRNKPGTSVELESIAEVDFQKPSNHAHF